MKSIVVWAGLLPALLSLFSMTDLVGDDSREVRLDPADSEREIIAKAASVVPTERQARWQEREYQVFVHFGVNTFTGRQWGNGKENPSIFYPRDFDARQWARVARTSGMKGLILTAKHHDGFCLWPSAYTEHSVKNSRWMNGKGDVVKAAAQACQKEGIAFGVYLSPWDRHEPTYGTPAYNDYFKYQLRELLTDYGEISEVWFDGAGTGEKHERMKDLYDWEGYFALVRQLQPEAVISISGPDVRWCGNEAGEPRPLEWSVVPEDAEATAPDLGSRARLLEAAENGVRLVWRPAQVDTSIRPSWFYLPWENLMVKSLPRLVDIYFGSVGGNAQLLLNVPPNREGLFAESDVIRLAQLKQFLDQTFDENLAASARALTEEHSPGHPAKAAVDGDPLTWWTCGVERADIEFDLARASSFNVAMVMEYIRDGQRLEGVCVDAFHDGGWRELACAETVGYKRLLRFQTVTAERIRLRILGSRARPTVSEFGLFRMPENFADR